MGSSDSRRQRIGRRRTMDEPAASSLLLFPALAAGAGAQVSIETPRGAMGGYPPMAGHSQEKTAAVTRAYSKASKSCLTCWDHGSPNHTDSRTRPQP